MKAVNVYFDDKEVKALEEAKGEKSWHDFFMELLTEHEENRK